MVQLWRIIRRLIFLCLTVFVSANAIAYFILNNPFVHEWFRTQANHQLQKAGLEVFIGPITVNFFETKLTVSRVKLSELSDRKKEFLDVGDFVVGFDPWRPNAYLIPSLKFISIQNWQADVSVFEKLQALSVQEDKKVLTVAEIIAMVRANLGRQIELKNGRLIRMKNEQIVSSILVNNVFAKFEVNSETNGLTLLADFGNSQLCLSDDFPCGKPLAFESLELNTEMDEAGGARIERLGLRSGFGDWTAGGQLKFGPQFRLIDYNLKVDGSADATPWFNLAAMQGRGRFTASVFVSPEGDNSGQRSLIESLMPVVHGQVAWSGVHLSGYDMYNGSADFRYSDLLVVYSNALITTPQGGTIEARGEYDLRDTKPFINTAQIRDFSFKELMAGLSVPTDVMDFKMDTRELLVTGLLNPGVERGFTLAFAGLVETSRIQVQSFEPNSVTLPNCSVQLKIDSDTNKMSFLGSTMTCQGADDSEQASVVLKSGTIDYIKSTNDFSFSAQGLPADIITYFVDESVEGSLNLHGRIFASATSPVSFVADVQINDGAIYGLSVSRASGRIRIDRNGFTGSDVEGWFDTDEQAPAVSARHIFVGFQNRKIEIDGKYDGKIRHFLRVFGEQGMAIADETQGHLAVSQFRLKGDMRNLLKSNLELRLKAGQVKNRWLSANDIQAVLACQQGWCSGSRIFLQNVSVGASDVDLFNSGSTLNSLLPRSKVIVELESVSQHSISARLDVQAVPVKIKSADRDFVSGTVDLRASVQGSAKDWEVSAQGRADRLVFLGAPLGSLSMNAASHGGGPLNVVLSGLFDQLQARLIFDHSFDKSTQMFANLRSFEVFRFLKHFGLNSQRISGEASADVSLEGPGVKSFFKDPIAAVEMLKGRGQISRLRVQVGREGMSLKTPVMLTLDESALAFSSMRLTGNLGRLESQGQIMIDTGHMNGSLNAQLDAGLLTQLTDAFTQASGDVTLQGEFERSDVGATFRGDARIENVTLGGKYLSPPLTAMNGRVVFQDYRIEVPSLTAAKGNGQVDFIGAVELPSSSDGSVSAPSVALRANLRSAQFRWPQEFFETVETTLDGQIELAGSGRPFSLNGDVRITKGRAYRDATCQDMIRGGPGGEVSVNQPKTPLFRLNMSIEADNSFTLQSTCIRGRVSTAVRLTGSESEPILSGQMRLDNGVLNLLKTRFEVMRADAVFDNIVKIEPRIDAQMVAKIEKYSVFIGAEGPFSKPRLNIWSDPSTGPDGNPLSRPALIRMISTGRGPSETTQTAVTQAIANQFVGLFDDPLSQVVSKITRGIVERFELQPIIDGGQSSFRARASRDLGEKFNLGLDYEPNRQSLTGTIFINESVNVLGGFDRRSSQLGSYSELSGGFRFQFGGK